MEKGKMDGKERGTSDGNEWEEKHLKYRNLHELIRTREWTFLSCISTKDELGMKGTLV